MRPMKVFITGASSGIGAQLARYYASRGATVGLVARRGEVLEALVATLPPALGTPHQILVADVTDAAALHDVAMAFMDVCGTPEIVIANAGISEGTLTEYAEDLPAFRRILETNVLATIATFQPFITPMRKLPAARLVGIASVAGVRGLPGAGAYSASKSAVRTYCEALRIELRNSPIRVVTIAPGYIATAMTKGNPYRMPFLMPVEKFVNAAAIAIDRGTGYRVIPWQMAIIAKLMRVMPNWLFDRLAAKARRKPRASSN